MKLNINSPSQLKSLVSYFSMFGAAEFRLFQNIPITLDIKEIHGSTVTLLGYETDTLSFLIDDVEYVFSVAENAFLFKEDNEQHRVELDDDLSFPVYSESELNDIYLGFLYAVNHCLYKSVDMDKVKEAKSKNAFLKDIFLNGL